VGTVGQWAEVEAGLPAGWAAVRVRLVLEPGEPAARAAALLAALQPTVSEARVLAIRSARDGTGPSPEMTRRALGSLDAEGIRGVLEVLEWTAAPEGAEDPERHVTLAEAWDAAVAPLPADWSDLFAEAELDSSDYLERAALNMAPLNPRRDGDRLALRFRSARRFGYGASAVMVRRCLARCDEEGMRGNVSVLWAFADTKPVHTQGPVWHLRGQTL